MDTVQNIIDTCQTCVSQQVPAAQSCCDATPSCDSSICITFIICLFILLLGIVIAITVYCMRRKQIGAKEQEEKQYYRKKLVDFLELLARDKKSEPSATECQNYIKELKKLAKDLTPTDPEA